MALKDQVLTAAETYTGRKNPSLRWDEWNFFYQQITAQVGPNPEQFGFKRRSDNVKMLDVDPMDVDFWWSHVSQVISGAGPVPTPTQEKPPSGGSPQPPGTSGNASNVFLDTLMTLLAIVFSGKIMA